MAEHKAAAEHKAQISAKGFQQIKKVLRRMNEVIQQEAQTSPKGQAQEQVEKLLFEQIKEVLKISETLSGEGKPLPTLSVPLGLDRAVRAAELTKISELLRLRPPKTLLDIHLHLLKGLSMGSVEHLIENMPRDRALEAALGISLRTIQRRRKAPRKPLSAEQSGRAFKFAEVLAKATDVFGSQEEAEAWLSRPAMGLNRQRPIDLLATPAGVELVETFLGRLEYDVYT